MTDRFGRFNLDDQTFELAIEAPADFVVNEQVSFLTQPNLAFGDINALQDV